MLVAELASHAGRFCAVATEGHVYYGELVRLPAQFFLIAPRIAGAQSPHAVRAEDVRGVTPLPDPR